VRLRRLAVWVGLMALVAGCASAGPRHALLSYDGQEGGLQLFVNPSDADVSVDGDYVGKVRDFQGDNVLWIPRGLHALEVRKAGYHTFFRQFEVSLGLVEIMVYTLQPNPEGR
jgi:PEGA domain